jgi:predicted AlkP superfamily pyrophosphatase or phosphodiesterase
MTMRLLTRPTCAALALLFAAAAVAQTPPTTAPAGTTAKTFAPTAEPDHAVATTPAARPVPAITHAVIISIDGCRPDLLLRGDTPVMHAMLDRGSFSMWARTTAESVTLPSHTSMVTGVQPTKHGIQWNADLPLTHPIYPAYPTLFQLAHQAGYTTAMAAGKSKFDTLNVPGSIDHIFVPEKDTIGNDPVADAAVEMIRQYRPGVLFVHLPQTDNAGHKDGWASPPYMAALHDADTCIGRILAALDEAGMTGSTFVLVTADHGGAGRGHGPDDARSRHIPWIHTGPGIRRGLDLTTFGDLQIDTEDTFSTACYLLGIPVVKAVEGKPITQVVARTELLK